MINLRRIEREAFLKRLAACFIVLICSGAAAQSPLAAPRFHHIHLNSTDPEAAIAFYMREFPSTAKTTWEGMPALASPDNVLVVFSRVARAPDADANTTAYRHFGWNVVDSRKSMETFRTQNVLAPFYTGEAGDFVGISSDTFCKAPRADEPSWPSLTRNGTFRSPTGGVSFSGVAMNWYPNQGARPLAPTRGHLIDHVGLAVRDLDAWIAKQKAENVTFLEQKHRIGETSAVLIEGPSHEAIELVEVK